jgi:CheY-like chemotaxis protein
MSGFDSAHVLIVEDNAQVRRLLGAVLRAIGVGRVVSASNGAEAIRILRTLGAAEAEGDPDARIDAVISDWVMHPGDGLALLRWIRRHRESPNRFVPFLMLSANSEPNRVRQARDLGASAFIAKPFMADTVARYLSTALADARRFVEIGEYFGPDRRKHRAGMSEEERRDLDRSDREKGVRFFVPPQLHEGRVQAGEGVDAQRLMAIQKVIQQRAEGFLDWTKETLARLDLEIDHAARRKPGERRIPFSHINLIAHELRGQGTTFGYPLVSSTAKGLFEATAHNFDRSDATLDLIRQHVKGLKQIVRDELTGDGGEAGQQLSKQLAASREAFEAQKPKRTASGPASDPASDLPAQKA